MPKEIMNVHVFLSIEVQVTVNLASSDKASCLVTVFLFIPDGSRPFARV